jgi:Lipoprotein LpqB beta-propeller domain
MTDRRAAVPRPARGVAALAVAVVLAAVLACGCAAIPSSGSPQSAAVPAPQGGDVAQCCGVQVEPPQVGWSPSEVVSNFLLASSNTANNYRAARAYLMRPALTSWHPGPGVTILSGAPSVTPRRPPNGPQGSSQVEVTGTELATLSSSGQYILAANDEQAPPEEFGLQVDHGVYKISNLPPASSGTGSGLLLTSDLFHQVYTPRNLYYYGGGQLLPDPVYVPVQSADLVSTLVNDLRHDPGGWLTGAAKTYFPAGARLAGTQVFPGPSGGKTAIVNISLPHGTKANIPNMVAQLVCTLTNGVFSPQLFHAVRIKINGRLWPVRGPAQNLASYRAQIPHWRSGMDVYYLTPGGSIRTLHATRSAALPRGASTGEPPLSQVAVSPDGLHLAGIAGPADTVYTGSLGSSAKPALLHTRLTGSFSALSWDSADDLWVVGRVSRSPETPPHTRQGIFVLRGGHGTPLPVSHPDFQGQVTGLRVAPDGVRVAMIIGSSPKTQVWLAAIRRGPTGGFSITQPVPLGGQGLTGVLTGVTALTWYDEDHLLVVTNSGSGTQLWEVPVDGVNPTSLGSEAGITSVTAAGPGNPFYLGLTGGRLVRVAGLNRFSQEITAGQAPAYPG